MSGQIKMGVTVETPHGKGIVVKVERYKCFRRLAVLYDKSPFSFNPVWYNHGKLKLVNENKTKGSSGSISRAAATS